jgi:hypothetical protein
MAGQRAGKSQMAGIMSGLYALNYPKLKGFIAANTYMQLIQSTLVKVLEIWGELYQLTEYDKHTNPEGQYVIDKRPPSHFKKFETYKNYNNIISFLNGHVIYVGSLDNYKAHDGKEFAYAHLDETKDTKKEAVTNVIFARLSQRGLYICPDGKELKYIPDYAGKENEIRESGIKSFNPVWIHTSPAIGEVEWLVEMFNLQSDEPEIRNKITGVTSSGKPDYYHKRFGNKQVVIFSTLHNLKNITDGWLELRMSTLSEKEQLKFIYGYPFAKTGGEYFPHFDRLKHVRECPYINNLPVHSTFDFNVLPYMTNLLAQTHIVDRYVGSDGIKYDKWADGRKHIRVVQVRLYKQYCLASPLNTVRSICDRFKLDHDDKPNNGVFLYGDASGKSRIAGMGSYTNFGEIKALLHRYLHSGSDRVGKKNVGVLKRRDFVNRILEGKYPTIELYIDPSCTDLIRDMEYLKLGEDGKLKERVQDRETKATYEKLGHCADALEYMLCAMFGEMMAD